MKIFLTAAAILFAALNCLFHYCAFALSAKEDEDRREDGL